MKPLKKSVFCGKCDVYWDCWVKYCPVCGKKIKKELEK